jgi:hypothetical protein
MGFGNCVVVWGSTANREEVGDMGPRFDIRHPEESLADLLQMLVDRLDVVAEYRPRVRTRIERFHNWEWIMAFHEELFQRLVRREALRSYDEHLSVRRIAGRAG